MVQILIFGGDMRISERKGHWLRLVMISLMMVMMLSVTGIRPVSAQDGDGEGVTIKFFWGDGCPVCAKAEPFLEGLLDRYDGVEIVKYEVWYNDVNQQLYQKTADDLDIPREGRGVPLIIIGERFWMGYNDDIGVQIEQVVKDQGATIVDPSASLEVPFIGRVNLTGKSTLLTTSLIAFVDGFNPCSVWVLTMLLALTLHTGSRKKVFLIGLIFLTVTAAIYGLFIAGIFATIGIARFIPWIQGLVALVALFFAVVNIKDYFFYKEGLSLSISDSSKPGIFQRMRRVMDASHNFWSLAGATVVLAAGVSLVEFSCTVGLPMMWASILHTQQVAAGTFGLLLLLYLVIYQLDEMIIFGTAVVTLKASKLEEKQGRILKLIGGVLMFCLAIVMLVNPRLLESIQASLLVFAVAFGLVVLILIIHRRILPSYGIWIGTEPEGKRKARSRHMRKSTR
jgi:thiol-disulfide isomerase/thioredoxin